jgi:hypothetical protein
VTAPTLGHFPALILQLAVPVSNSAYWRLHAPFLQIDSFYSSKSAYGQFPALDSAYDTWQFPAQSLHAGVFLLQFYKLTVLALNLLMDSFLL